MFRPPRSHLVLAALIALGAPAGAQLVTPKTVPVFQDEQFNLAPASRGGLGSAFIGLEDTLADPFVNPAKLSRMRGVSAAAAPYNHSISGERGGGQTLPVALFAAGSEWAGAALVAYQNLDRAGPAASGPSSGRTSSNQYLSGLLARRVGGVSVGASASHAGLEAVDGVDLLYAGSDRIEQKGSVREFRLGALRELGPGHALEVLGIHNRTEMTHDVRFTTWAWDPVARVTVPVRRQEHNVDETHIWGVHSRYHRPVGSDGWRIGGILTANRLSHPKIPNYVIQNVPRDPGTTLGYDLGIGAARIAGPSSFFIDLVVQPMRSETWADLPRDTTDAQGVVIPAGERTIENRFNFHNSTARVGAGHVFPVNADSSNTLSVDLGLSVYTIGYGLHQTNNIAHTTREQAERWAEVTRSLGLRFRSRDVEVSYVYRRTCGNQGCDENENRGVIVFADAAVARTGGIIAAPSGPLFVQSGTERSHRFVVRVPIR